MAKKERETVYMSVKVLGRPTAVLRFMNVGLSFDGSEGFGSTEFGTKRGTKVMKASVHGTVREEDYQKLKKFMSGESYIEVEDTSKD